MTDEVRDDSLNRIPFWILFIVAFLCLIPAVLKMLAECGEDCMDELLERHRKYHVK